MAIFHAHPDMLTTSQNCVTVSLGAYRTVHLVRFID